MGEARSERRHQQRREEDRLNRLEDRIERLDKDTGAKLDDLLKLVTEVKIRLDVSSETFVSLRASLAQDETRLTQLEREMTVARLSGRGAWEVAKLVLVPTGGVIVGFLLAGKSPV